jgi:hypothetical protein
MFKRLAVIAAMAVTSLVVLQGTSEVTRAKDFDITGTIDCGQVSGNKCRFSDWATGPRLTVITSDLGSGRQPVVVDASWIRNDLPSLEQDDFVWFTLRDDAGPGLRAIGIREERCKAGTFNQGLSTQSTCVREQGDVTNDNEP